VPIRVQGALGGYDVDYIDSTIDFPPRAAQPKMQTTWAGAVRIIDFSMIDFRIDSARSGILKTAHRS
jgi:hypothetical protein